MEKGLAGKIITVNGPIEPGEMGFTLPHEHVLVDFTELDTTGERHRYNRNDVIETMLPMLRAARSAGVRTFIDATPKFLGRDPKLLRELSELSGLHMLTNTGLYKEPHLPRYAFDQKAAELAESWVEEFEGGIDGSGVRPGFITIAVNPGILHPMQRKIVRAAAIVSRLTGLTIAAHTASAIAALETLSILEEEDVSPQKWIFVHAQEEPDHNEILEVASRGCWIELDGIAPGTIEKHLVPLVKLADAGFLERILLSQDAGWYRVGEEPGAKKKPYDYLPTGFLEILSSQGFDSDTLEVLTVSNPARAYAIG